MYPKCAKLSMKLLKNELESHAFRHDFERSPRGAEFETFLLSLKPSTFAEIQNTGSVSLISIYREHET